MSIPVHPHTSGTTQEAERILHVRGGFASQTSYTHTTLCSIQTGHGTSTGTTDVGWVTGHSYIVYGPLANRATQVLYEGTPDTPKGTLVELIEKYRVSILYTAPTAIAPSQSGARDPNEFDLTSLRLLGSVGEPINPAAWILVPPRHRR